MSTGTTAVTGGVAGTGETGAGEATAAATDGKRRHRRKRSFG